MEIVIIVLAVVFSIWSEINKKKQEEDVDLDFSELTSLDDFFKKSSASAASSPKTLKGSKRSRNNSESKSINYDELPSLTGKSYDQEPARPDVNYDALPSLSGQINFEEKIENEGLAAATAVPESAIVAARSHEAGRFTIDRNDLLKSFVMAEVLQRYNISRIYDRIPGIKSDN